MLDLGAQSRPDVRNTQPPRGSALRVYGRLLGYAFRYKGRLLVSLLFALIVVGSFSSMVLSVGTAVQIIFGEEEVVREQLAGINKRIAHGTAMAEQTIGWAPRNLEQRLDAFVTDMRADPMRTLKVLCVVLLVLAMLSGVARFLQEYFAGMIGASISVELGREMFANIMRMSLTFFEEHSSGELLARFTNDIFMVNRGLAGVFVKLLREPIKALVFLVMALMVNAKLTLTVVVVLPLVAWLMLFIGRKVKKSVRRSLQKIGSMVSVASETFRGIRIVKSFCMEAYETRRVNVEFDLLRKYLIRMVRADAAIGPVTEFFLMIGVVVFLLAAGREIAAGRLEPGSVVILCGALAFMFDPLRKLSVVNNLIQTSVASAERVFEYIDREPDVVEKPGALILPPLQSSLRFEAVRFSYDHKAEVLKGASFEVKKGEMIALVGPSGAGKSTIVSLIPRFYDVTGGAVLIDETDIREATFKSLRDQISIVTQDTVLFDESVRDNIAYGRDDYTDERIREAARAAHATGFIEKLPHAYETGIGESGDSLSGGQRQRLAIARAIIKDPAILILDEATSSLDSESEQAIQTAIAEFVKGRTSIVIAHRLSTVQQADRILVIDEGQLVEEGTHQQLLARGGIYRRLYETQFVARDNTEGS